MLRRRFQADNRGVKPIYHFPLLTDANDVIGGVKPIVNNNMTYSTAMGGYFSGISSFLQYPAIFNGLSEFTLTFETYPLEFNNYRAFLGLKRDGASNANFYIESNNGLLIRRSLQNGTTKNTLLSLSIIQLNVWQKLHIAVRNGVENTIWLNNQIIDNVALNSTFDLNRLFNFGTVINSGSSNRSFSGYQKNVKIYDKFLTPEETA